jgi:hypothetical protein
MATLLENLQLEEVSLVDTPANQEAAVMLFKRDTSKEDNEQMDHVIKMSDDMKAKLKPYLDKGMSPEEAMKAYEEDMKKEKETMKAENERLRKALIENEFVIKADSIEKKAPVEYIEVEGEQIVKADIPAPILKRLEEAEAEKAQAAIEKKAEEFSNLNKDVAVKLVKADLLEDEELLAFLRAVDAMFEKAMDETGESKTDAEMVSAEEKLNKMAKDRASEKSVSFAKAYAEVLDTPEGKTLYKELTNKED